MKKIITLIAAALISVAALAQTKDSTESKSNPVPATYAQFKCEVLSQELSDPLPIDPSDGKYKPDRKGDAAVIVGGLVVGGVITIGYFGTHERFTAVAYGGAMGLVLLSAIFFMVIN